MFGFETGVNIIHACTEVLLLCFSPARGGNFTCVPHIGHSLALFAVMHEVVVLIRSSPPLHWGTERMCRTLGHASFVVFGLDFTRIAGLAPKLSIKLR